MAQSIQHHCAGNAVIQVGRHQAGLRRKGRHPGNRRVPHPDQVAGMGRIPGPNVYVEVGNGHIFQRHIFTQRDHTTHPIFKPEGGVENVLRPDPTQLSKGEVPRLVNVGDD